MKKLLLSILSISTIVLNAQWSTTTNFTGTDCITAFGKVFSANGGGSNGLDVSTDEGATWSVSNTGITTGVKFGTLYNGTNLFAISNSSIFAASTGSSWSLSNSGIPGSETIYSMTSLTGTIMAASSTGGTIYGSTNTGATWTVRSSNLSGKLITVIRNLGGNIFVGTTGATFSVAKSTDGGLTFTNASSGIPTTAWFDKYINCLAAINSTTLFCGTHGGKLCKSTNGGTSWTTAYTIGSGTTIDFSDIYVSGTKVLTASDSGFIYSNDNGNTWTKNNLGLNYASNENYLSHITMTANYIVASTKNGRILRRPISEIFAGIKEIAPTIVESKAFPNPASNFATIEASDLTYEDNCEVKLNDILGREIGVFEMNQGKCNIDLSNFNKGLYTYSVYANKVIASKGKLIVN